MHRPLLQLTGLFCALPLTFAFPRSNVQTGRERSKIKRNNLPDAVLLFPLQVPFWGNNFGYFLNSIILEVLFNLNDSMILIKICTGHRVKLCCSSWGVIAGCSSKAASEIHLPSSPFPEGRIKIHLRVCSSFFSNRWIQSKHKLHSSRPNPENP